MQVKVNFGGVFATIKDEKILKEVANSISEQLKSAYTKRLAELAKSVKTKAEVVEIKAEGKSAPKAKSEAAKESKPKTAKESKTESKERTLTLDGEAVPQIALTNTKELKKLGLKFIPYSEKCVILSGNTKPIHAELKNMRKDGVFGNMHLKKVKGFEGGFGWLVNKENKSYKNVCKKLGLKAV